MTTNNQEPLGGEKCVCGNPTSRNIMHRTEGPCYVDEASEQFATYFAKNYPANTIISDPAWHAPRIFRAAKHVLASQPQAGAAGASEVKPWQERTDEITPTSVVMAMEQEIADLRTQLACQRQGQGEPVRYEHRLRAPNGHCGDWSSCDKEIFDRFSATPDAGDGFSYETRALYTTPAPQAHGEPVALTGTVHDLKTDPEVFAAVLLGAKTHEIRLNDRGFAVGDTLLLRETASTGAEMAAGAPLEYTGRTARRIVSHVLTGYGLQDGWCILSFAGPAAQADEVRDAVIELQNAYGALERIEEQHLGLAEHRCAANRYHLAASKLVDVARKGTKKGGGQ